MRLPFLSRFNRRQTFHFQHTNRSVRDLNLQAYQTLLSTGLEIAKKNPSALPSLIAAILRPEQSELLLGVGERGRDAHDTVDGHGFFFDSMWDVYNRTGVQPSECQANEFPVLLGTDPVLPCPWNVNRFIDAMSFIGSGKVDQQRADRDDYGGRWRQDANHSVSLWLPWRIGFVSGGNHSIAAGILAGEGTIIADRVYDFSFIFDFVTCDGSAYHLAGPEHFSWPVTDVRRAAVFEIGRIIARG